jgi:hypothetical protein
VRGGEAFDLLQALNTGHSGTLSTIHANSAEQALARFSSCVVQSGVELPYQAVRYQIADAIDLVLHLGRTQGARVVRQLIRISRYDAERERYEADVLFSQGLVETETRVWLVVKRRRLSLSVGRCSSASTLSAITSPPPGGAAALTPPARRPMVSIYRRQNGLPKRITNSALTIPADSNEVRQLVPSEPDNERGARYHRGQPDSEPDHPPRLSI